MKKTVFALASALIATTATGAIAQTDNTFNGPVVEEQEPMAPIDNGAVTSDIEADTRVNIFRGPVAPAQEVRGMVDAPEADVDADADARFNTFSGPIIEQ